MFRATHIHYLTVSVEQASGCGLAESSGPEPLMLGLQLGLLSTQGSTGEGSASSLTQEAAGRIQFLTGCWTEGLSSSLADGQRLPFSIRQFIIWQLASIRASKQKS